MLKRSFIIAASATMLFSSVPTSFAGSLKEDGAVNIVDKKSNLFENEAGLSPVTQLNLPDNVEILEDTQLKLVVKETTEDGITISTNNKTTQTLNVEKYEMDGKTLVSSLQFDLKEIEATYNNEQLISPLVFSGDGDVYQHTITNREYDIKITNSTREWRLRSKDSYKYVTQTPTNKEDLELFRTAVEGVNTAENSILAVAGVATILVFMTAGVGAAISAGGGAGVSGFFIVLNERISDADYHFSKFPRSR